MKQTTKNILGVATIGLFSAGIAGFTTYKVLDLERPSTEASTTFSDIFEQNDNCLRLAAYEATDAQPVDLTAAAESSVNAVVHIKTTQESKTQTVTVRDPF